MCYAIPAQLVEIRKRMGIVDYFGERRTILLDDTPVKVGDYVYAQGGVLVRTLPPEEACSILATWKELFFQLKKTDEILSSLKTKELPGNVLGVLQRINLRKTLSPSELKALFSLKTPQELAVLYEVANHVRQREHGNASCVHGILEFSNYCRQNCHYCGIRRDHAIPRYRLSPEEIIAIARQAVEEWNFKAIVLQSGEDCYYDEERLVHIVREVRRCGVLVFVSLGSREKSVYERLYEAGARAALIRFETANEKLFAQLRPGDSLERRVELIEEVKKMGYVLATGFILGLPGETVDDVVNAILLTKRLDPDMYSFGPLIPSDGTPLADASRTNIDEVYKTIAITRLAAATSNILITTAMETLDEGSSRQGLLAGGNSMMVNLTPQRFKKLYAIYDGRSGVEENIADSIQRLTTMLCSLGRSPADIGTHSRVTGQSPSSSCSSDDNEGDWQGNEGATL